MKKHSLVLMFTGMAASAYAAVSFEPAKNYPHLGIMFPRLANAQAEPVPMPEAHAYLLTGEATLVREDRFAPYELWYNTECCARWRDPAGNKLIIGRIVHRLPVSPERHISRAEFGTELDDETNLIDPTKQDLVNEWVATFVKSPVYKPEPLKLNAFTLKEVLYYPCGTNNMLVYAFRPRRVGNAKNFDWFCVTLQAPGETDFERLRASFEEDFIGQVALPPRSAKDEGIEAEELTTERHGEKASELPDHPVRVEARKSVENYDDWWFAETEGYIIIADVHTSVGEAFIHDLQATLPAMRLAYAKLVPPITRENDVSLIRLFQNREQYARYVGDALAWSSGMWMPGRRELVLFQQENKNDMMRIVRHEAFHQYLSYASCMLNVAPWLNEGHACLFENASVGTKNKVSLDEDPDMSRLLLDNMEAVVALLPSLLNADYAEFYAGTGTERRLKYAIAWGLAYYLQKGAPLERNTPFKNILPDYAAALAQTHSGEEATVLAFKDVDMRVFQENFREFWLKRRGAAMQYDPLEQ